MFIHYTQANKFQTLRPVDILSVIPAQSQSQALEVKLNNSMHIITAPPLTPR